MVKFLDFHMVFSYMIVDRHLDEIIRRVYYEITRCSCRGKYSLWGHLVFVTERKNKLEETKQIL